MKNLFCWLVAGLALFAASGGISGCAFQKKVQKEVGVLNLQYEQKGTKNSNIDLPIAIISPEIAANAQPPSPPQQAPNPMVAMMMQQSRPTNFNHLFASGYSAKLYSALEYGLQQIVTHKGFTITGPFSAFDDITYGEKKNTFLALVPHLNIDIQNKVTDQNSNSISRVHSIKGIIQVAGELRIDLIEPMTGEKILAKRINLSTFNINKQYTKESQIAGGSMISNALTSQQSLTDNTDKALVDAINEFYAKAMAKIDTYISPDEISSFKDQVNTLKGLKRF